MTVLYVCLFLACATGVIVMALLIAGQRSE